MKLGVALMAALLSGCAAAPRPMSLPGADVRGEADSMRVDLGYRPPPTGSNAPSVHFDHPPKAYYATCVTKRTVCFVTRRPRR